MNFWPQSVHFRSGPPTIFRKHMPSGMGTESLGVIGCIFAENGPLEGGIESSFFGKWTLSGFVRSRSESLWWFEVDFWPLSVHFRRGPRTIFRKHKPSGMGTESLGMMGCIFAENGPLEGGIESSFCSTGWVIRVISHGFLAPIRAFSKEGPPPFSESTCPQVWAQKVWEWSDVYSRRIGP